MSENEISRIIVDAAFKIHVKWGPGLLESVYEHALKHLIEESGLKVQSQRPIPVYWNEKKLEIGFRADLIVENKVIVEIKSLENLAKVHPKQLLTYLKIAKMKLGLLINFNEVLIKDGITRIVNNL